MLLCQKLRPRNDLSDLALETCVIVSRTLLAVVRVPHASLDTIEDGGRVEGERSVSKNPERRKQSESREQGGRGVDACRRHRDQMQTSELNSASLQIR